MTLRVLHDGIGHSCTTVIDSMGQQRTPKPEVDLKPIDPAKMYPLEHFQVISGMGRAAMRSARDAGLTMHYVGGRAWILGSDWIEYVVANGRSTKDG